MGTTTRPATVQKGAIRHLRAALDADASAEQNFHVKQALQLLDVAEYDS